MVGVKVLHRYTSLEQEEVLLGAKVYLCKECSSFIVSACPHSKRFAFFCPVCGSDPARIGSWASLQDSNDLIT